MKPNFELTVLTYNRCSQTPIMVEALKRVIKTMDLDIEPTYIGLENLEPEDVLTAFGSPTLLIDGKDMLGAPHPSVPAVPS